MNKEGDYDNEKLLKDLRDVAQQLKEVEERKDMSCAVCKEELKKHVLIPCGHFGLCETCKNRFEKEEKEKEQKEKCPICKKSIETYLKLFPS
jgi:rubrerythrin